MVNLEIEITPPRLFDEPIESVVYKGRVFKRFQGVYLFFWMSAPFILLFVSSVIFSNKSKLLLKTQKVISCLTVIATFAFLIWLFDQSFSKREILNWYFKFPVYSLVAIPLVFLHVFFVQFFVLKDS